MDKDRNEKIKKMRMNGLTYTKIASIFNLSKQRIYQIVTGYRKINNAKTRRLYVKIKIRDSYKCKYCGEKKLLKLVIHHIDHNVLNNNELNLVTMCKSCHSSLHASKSGLGKKNMSIKQPTDEEYLEAIEILKKVSKFLDKDE